MRSRIFSASSGWMTCRAGGLPLEADRARWQLTEAALLAHDPLPVGVGPIDAHAGALGSLRLPGARVSTGTWR